MWFYPIVLINPKRPRPDLQVLEGTQLNRQLCGKLWVSQMCLNRDFRVPPTTRLHFQEFLADPSGVAKEVVERLQSMQHALWNEKPVAEACFRGVAKLGSV